MDQLWAPWRLAYVATPKPPGSEDPCFLCANLQAANDRENLIVQRGERCQVVLNRFPYNNGHLLIAPNSHKANLEDLSVEESLEIHQTLAKMVALLKQLMKPDGFNIGLNLGKAAGAGLPGHLHWHVVPRWQGDVNFMPVFSDTRVIVQSLDAAWEYLTSHLQ